MRTLTLGRLLFLALGTIALGVAAWQAFQVANALRTFSRAPGVAVGAPGEIETYGHPKIRFRTSTGAETEFVQNGFGPSRVGMRVTVLYQLGDPANAAQIESFWALWGKVLLPLALGPGLVGVVLLGAEVVPVRGRFGFGR